MAIKFVVPSKLILARGVRTSLSQRDRAAGNLNDRRDGSGARWKRRDEGNIFLRSRQVMEEIGKGLGVHQAVLERNREHLLRYLVREIIYGLPNA